jgi:hypothetical protein
MAPDPDPAAGPAPPAQPPPPGPPGPLRPEEERIFATLIHLSGLLWLLSFPGIVGVLLIWLLKRDRSAFVDAHGKEALNFQISFLIYGIGLTALAIVGFVLTFILVGIFLLVPAVVASVGLIVLQVVTAILGALEANRGGYYRYPLAIRFIH